VMGITLGNVAQSFGVQGTSASVGTMVSATIPIFIVILAALRLKQPVSLRQWFGLVVAFGGIALIAIDNGSGTDDLSKTTLTGMLWILISAIAIAVYYIWSAELTDQYGTLPVAAWNVLVGFITIIPLSAVELTYAPFRLTGEAIAVTVYLGVMVTVVGLILWLYLLRNVPARIAASVQYLQPVIGIAAAALMFGDSLGMKFGLGVVLVLGGLALAVAKARSSQENASR